RRMREALVEVLDDDARVVQHEIAVDERRHAVVRVQVEQVLGEVTLLDVDDVDVDALLGEDQPRAMTPRVGRPRKERHDRSTVGDYRHARSLLGACPQNEASRSRKYAVERPQQAIIARTGSLRTDEAIGALSGDVLPDF